MSITDDQIIAAVRSGMNVVEAQKRAVTIEQPVFFDVTGEASIAAGDPGEAVLTIPGTDWAALGVEEDLGLTVDVSGFTAPGNNQAFPVISALADALTLNSSYTTITPEAAVDDVRVRSASYDPWTGQNAIVWTSTTTKGWLGMYTLRMIQDGGYLGRDIQQGDQRLIIDKRDFTTAPARGAIVTAGSERFTVVDIETDPFDLVTIIQLRRAQ